MSSVDYSEERQPEGKVTDELPSEQCRSQGRADEVAQWEVLAEQA